MDLPDCPPGTEGYEDTVVTKPIPPPKPVLKENVASSNIEGSTATKAEVEFLEHLKSLKIRLEDGSVRTMVERRGRDISGQWIYLCFPCAAVCAGEFVLQNHISGKKHKTKLGYKNVWPVNIFTEHPHVLMEKGIMPKLDTRATKVVKKQTQETNEPSASLNEETFKSYRDVRCHLQDILDETTAPLLGLEYLIEHPPEEEHYEPTYLCALCIKRGHPRTIVNHLTCFWHRYNYVTRHFKKAGKLLADHRSQKLSKKGVGFVMHRLAQCIENKYGRLKPVNFQKEEFDANKDQILEWIGRGEHFVEKEGCTFEEVIDADLIDSLNSPESHARDPSPPVVSAPSKPANKVPKRRSERPRHVSIDSLSDISDSADSKKIVNVDKRDAKQSRTSSQRYEPYPDRRRDPVRYRAAGRPAPHYHRASPEKQRPPNYEFKLKLAKEMRDNVEQSVRKTLTYHEKNPEKHPLYPEEWKKFWNRRYKELQTEGKDPTKYDFKPEWIKFWTARMKELHEEELRVALQEIYRKMRLTPPDSRSDQTEKRTSIERKHIPERRRSPERRKSPDRRRSPDRRLSPFRRRSIERRLSPRRRSPQFRRTDMHRRRTPIRETPPHMRRMSRDRRSPPPSLRRRSPHHLRTRSRSPMRSRSPRIMDSRDSPRPMTSRASPLSVRNSVSCTRDGSTGGRNPSPAPVPSMQTVLVSDDELKPESPWDSDVSLGSLPDVRSPRSWSRSRSHTDSAPTTRHRIDPKDFGTADNVVGTMRLLVALEDHLGSLGPKVVDLLAEAIRMEKERPNSSEELLDRETAVVLIETAKEKLKGALQAGLVSGGRAAAMRTAVVRVAATLHEADTRAQRAAQKTVSDTGAAASSKRSGAGVSVAGVGEVDREQIAAQMAAALIAQGKTDVSAEELAQLVDAVVGMAEAKKREAVLKKQASSVGRPAPADAATRPHASSSAASALQLLQSAYDEKRMDKEDVSDAMDGLSDSDLETLLKNFNELSAEEQHSLIAYLKKLEAKQPTRVEKLRQYVSAAASNAGTAPVADGTPVAAAESVAVGAVDEDLGPAGAVTIESDDDDYSVEEVFESATKKVNEDQIRHEMEIVKKSLETKQLQSPAPVEPPRASSLFDLTKNMSSASDLLALVQASIKSTNVDNLAPIAQVPISVQSVTYGERNENDNDQTGQRAAKSIWDTEPWSQQSDNESKQHFNCNSQESSEARGNFNSSQTEIQNTFQQDLIGQSYNQRNFSPAPGGGFNSLYQGQRDNTNTVPRSNVNNEKNESYDNRQPASNAHQQNQLGNRQFGNQQQHANVDQYVDSQGYDNRQGYDNKQFNNQQSYNNQQQFGNQQNYGNSQPQYGNQQSYSNNQPQFGNQQSYVNQHQYGNIKQYGNNQQNYGNQQQFGNKQPFINQNFVKNNRGRGVRGGRGRGRGFQNL